VSQEWIAPGKPVPFIWRNRSDGIADFYDAGSLVHDVRGPQATVPWRRLCVVIGMIIVVLAIGLKKPSAFMTLIPDAIFMQ
jgi:hypothetical protein